MDSSLTEIIVMGINHWDANLVCKSRKSSLPSVRDLAIEAQKNGAAGVKETAFRDIFYKSTEVQAEIANMQAAGYVPIFKKNSIKIVTVDFYYSNYGYIAPKSDNGKFWFWSNALDAFDSRNAYGLAGNTGKISHDGRMHDLSYHAVRCLKSIL